MRARWAWVTLFAVTVTVLLSIRYADIPVALFFQRLMRWNPRWRSYTSHLPDLLTAFVVAGTVLSWSGWGLSQRRGRAHAAEFLRLTGTALPASYFVKEALKFVFARTDTRAWLAHRASYGFHWLQGGHVYGAFPSGHMTVFTAFFTALWLYYDCLRPLCFGALALLAIALVATDYHYLSDVVAGAYIGAMVTLAARSLLAWMGRDGARVS